MSNDHYLSSFSRLACHINNFSFYHKISHMRFTNFMCLIVKLRKSVIFLRSVYSKTGEGICCCLTVLLASMRQSDRPCRP